MEAHHLLNLNHSKHRLENLAAPISKSLSPQHHNCHPPFGGRSYSDIQPHNSSNYLSPMPSPAIQARRLQAKRRRPLPRPSQEPPPQRPAEPTSHDISHETSNSVQYTIAVPPRIETPVFVRWSLRCAITMAIVGGIYWAIYWMRLFFV